MRVHGHVGPKRTYVPDHSEGGRSEFTADTLRHVAKQLRRTAKALPTIAVVREACERETVGRRRLAWSLEEWPRDHARLIEEDQREAERIAAAARAHIGEAAPGAADVKSAWRAAELRAWLKVHPTRCGEDGPPIAYEANRALVRALAAGNPIAAAWVGDVIRYAASEPDDHDAWSAWRETAPTDRAAAAIGWKPSGWPTRTSPR